MSINTSVIELKVVWHVGVPYSSLQAADFFVAGLKCSHKMVDAGAGSSELLGRNGGASLHCGGKAVCHCMRDFTEFISAEVDEGFSRPGG